MAEVEEFVALKGCLFGVAYRMLGSVTDAEDIVQEAYLRWQGTDRGHVRSPEAFLTTVVVRLSLDQLRSARVRRESYVGPWLPEPLLVDEHDPATAVELSDSLSMAFLVLLESLSPAERAAFLLHDVFGYPYGDIAAMLERPETACRQLVSRARREVEQRRHRYDADVQRGRELARRFQSACVSGDFDGMLALLADDVTVWTDGGGVVKAARRPVSGARKAARFLIAIAADTPPTTVVQEALVNGQPGLVLYDADAPFATLTFEVLDDRIAGVRVVTNPHKLAAVRRGTLGRASPPLTDGGR